MKKNISLAIASLLLFSCSEHDFDATSSINNQHESFCINDSLQNEEQCMKQFSRILSKAISQDRNVREFLKVQALKKIDNGSNIFYPIAKDERLGMQSFKEVLSKYTDNKDELDIIETVVPLLNIHIPEYGDIKVENLDLDDNEIPVLYENKLYYAGDVVDSLDMNELPGFHVFTIGESSSIRVKDKLTRSIDNYSIDDKYEYVDRVFDPTYNNVALTRTSGTEVLSDKYSTKGYVPYKDIDPQLLSAFNNSKGQKKATRYLMYYGLNSINETPKTMRTDVRDCIFRFKIAADAFTRFKDIAEGAGSKKLFYESTENKKSTLSREEVLKRLLTGRAFCFLFKTEGSIDGNTVITESMKIYATPDKIFNLSINEHRRHPTMFRHTKYTYTLRDNEVEAKWFYPLDYGHDTRFSRWDITKDPIEKKVFVYLINPDEGRTDNITETYKVSYINDAEFGGNASVKIKEIVTLGINGKLNNKKTKEKTVTTSYTVSQANEKIDEFVFDYFSDNPIEYYSQGNYVIPVRKGKGVIETSIIPISNEFFTIKRFEK